jgi:hypothetical protein
MSSFKTFLAEAACAAIDVCGDVMEKKKKQQQQNNSSSHKSTRADSVSAANTSVASDFDDGSNIPLSTCDGNKKSLFIGINYVGTRAELRGCINDVINIKKFVVQNFGFPTDSQHMRTLVDNDSNNMPTRANVIQAFQWLVKGAKSGDSLFLHYSGHGGSVEDTDGDEADGMDETIIPVDYEKAGQIVDDELHAILVAGLPEGVRLTAIMDCCHSGSVFDLPYTYGVDGNLEIQEVDNRKAAMEAAIQAGISLIQGDKKRALTAGIQALTLYYTKPNENGSNKEARQKQIKVRSAVADVIQFSGCRDEQTSADACIQGQSTGAMSWSFIHAFEQNGYNQNYVQLLGNVRKLLHGKYTQVPQMSTGHRMDVSTKFKM